MNYQQLRPTPSQYRSNWSLVLIVIVVFLVVAIVAGLLSPLKDVPSVYLSIIVSISVLAGLIGLYVAAARQFGLWLPQSLHVPEKSRDENWRLVALSLAAIIFPLIIVMISRALVLMIQHSLIH